MRAAPSRLCSWSFSSLSRQHQGTSCRVFSGGEKGRLLPQHTQNPCHSLDHGSLLVDCGQHVVSQDTANGEKSRWGRTWGAGRQEFGVAGTSSVPSASSELFALQVV